MKLLSYLNWKMKKCIEADSSLFLKPTTLHLWNSNQTIPIAGNPSRIPLHPTPHNSPNLTHPLGPLSNTTALMVLSFLITAHLLFPPETQFRKYEDFGSWNHTDLIRSLVTLLTSRANNFALSKMVNSGNITNFTSWMKCCPLNYLALSKCSVTVTFLSSILIQHLLEF